MRALVVAVLLLAGCAPKMVALPKPELGAEVTVPSKSARIVFASGTRLHALWAEPVAEEYELRYAALEGMSWTAPVVVSRSRVMLSGGSRGPHLLARRDGSLTACWFEGETARIAHSTDGGASWARAFSIHGGWKDASSLAFMENSKGKLVAAWVQTVTKAVTEPVEMALIADETTNFRDAVAYGQQVCRECGFSASSATDGGYLAFRHQSTQRATHGGESTVVLMKTDRAGRAAPLTEHEGWKIEGDPEAAGSGPVVSTDGVNAVTAWFSAVPKRNVSVMMSTDRGRTFRGWRIPAEGHSSGFAASWSNGISTLAWLESVQQGRARVRSMRFSRAGVSPVSIVTEADRGTTAWLGTGAGETFLALTNSSGTRLLRLGTDTVQSQ